MSAAGEEAVEATACPGSALEVLRVCTRLGLTSFGGPVAHLGFFRAEYVERRRWLDETQYADVVALSQFLPGPASSKVGIIIGTLRAGIPGALAAWLGFTAPSALAMVAFGYGVTQLGGLAGSPWGSTASRSLPSQWSPRRSGEWREASAPIVSARRSWPSRPSSRLPFHRVSARSAPS